ncbi:MAG: hypothetical protein ACPGVU_06690, partial [Limisphaerales bacterium]
MITYPDYSAGGTSVCAKCSKSVKLPPASAAPAPSAPTAKQPIRTKEPIGPGPKPRPKPNPAPRATAPPKPNAPAPPKPRARTAPQYVAAPKRRGPRRFILWTLNLGIIVAVAIVLINRQKDDE